MVAVIRILPFTEYVDKWLLASKPSLATTTFQGYRTLIKARIKPYFDPLGLRLMDVKAHHIDDFYQTIFDDGCTANTVIHYHLWQSGVSNSVNIHFRSSAQELIHGI